MTPSIKSFEKLQAELAVSKKSNSNLKNKLYNNIKNFNQLRESFVSKEQEIEHRKIFDLFNRLNKMPTSKSQRIFNNSVKRGYILL